MALASWNSSYSVGVKSIDTQHTVLFDILNELHDAMMKGQASNVTSPLLKKLVKYTQEHFAAEEKTLEAAKYPGLRDHQVKHADLIRQVQEYVVRHDKGEITVNMQLMNFLRDWLTNHIQKVDKEYGSWLNSHGVS
jgi:hemerythrin-like metal-binding protein